MPTTVPTPERRTHVYKVVEGHSIRADVLGAEPGNRKPCVLWIHGGGLIFGSRTVSPRPTFAQALLDCGFVVVSIDHRLAPEAKLPAIVDDVRDAWHWMHQMGASLFGIDPARMAIAGASAGGYLSLLAGTVFAPRPRALASFWGYGDITAAWEAEPSDFYRKMALVDRQDAVARLHDQPGPGAAALADRSLFYLYCRQQGRWLQEVTGRDPLTDGVWLERHCPLRNIDAAYPPTVLVHGTHDSDVPHAESAALAQRLAAVGVMHRFVSLPGIGHGFAGAEPQAAQAVERDVAEFLVHALGAIGSR